MQDNNNTKKNDVVSPEGETTLPWPFSPDSELSGSIVGEEHQQRQEDEGGQQRQGKQEDDWCQCSRRNFSGYKFGTTGQVQ
jgi:hypothetical protein